MNNLDTLYKKLQKHIPTDKLRNEASGGAVVYSSDDISLRMEQGEKKVRAFLSHEDLNYEFECGFEAAMQLVTGLYRGTVSADKAGDIVLRLSGWDHMAKEHSAVKQVICSVIAVLIILPSLLISAAMISAAIDERQLASVSVSVLFAFAAAIGVMLIVYGVRQSRFRGNIAVCITAMVITGVSATLLFMGIAMVIDERRAPETDDIGVTVLFTVMTLIGAALFWFGKSYLPKSKDLNFFLIRKIELPPHDDKIRLLKAVHERTQCECISVTFSDEPPKISDSKVGGLPYLKKGMSAPKGENGEPMIMLFQLNFAQLPENGVLPSEGILQIFTTEKEFYNVRWDLGSEVLIKAVYYDDASECAPSDDIKTRFPITTDDFTDEDYAPVHGAAAMRFERLLTDVFAFSNKNTQILHEEAQRMGIPLDKTATLPELVQTREDEVAYGVFDLHDFMLGNEMTIDGEQCVRLLMLEGNENMCFNDGGCVQLFIRCEDLENGEFEKVRLFAC